MNRKLIFRVTGRLLESLAAILLLPMLVSIIYHEKSFVAFLFTAIISYAISRIMRHFCHNVDRVIYAKEGFIIVALAWLSASLIGSLPFVLSGEIPSFADAFFESVSGFTTTGASILTDVESLSHGMLFWRSFTHWIGGMGVLVFIIAFVSNVSERSIHILRAEMPGPIVGKLMPRAKDTTKILYIMYIFITAVEIVMLWLGGMPLFDSIVHAFGTAGTGGFGIKADSVAGYSPYIQYVIGAFMLIFGINFNLYYLASIKRFKTAIKSTELWVYIAIVAASVVLVATNIFSMCGTVEESIRASFFQVSSIITTTGYSTVDFNLWPAFSKGILFILMFIGGCAGSTAGGLKVSRVILLFKMVFKELRHMIHPRSVASVKFEGKEVDDHTQKSVASYFAVYMIFFAITFFIISLEPFDFETAITATAACFNNIGPGFSLVGPMGSYADFSGFSKIVLSFAMLLGRLEIFPLVIALIPSTWTRKK